LAKLGPTKVNNHTALTTSFQAFWYENGTGLSISSKLHR
jgi:hypothetical protein